MYTAEIEGDVDKTYTVNSLV